MLSIDDLKNDLEYDTVTGDVIYRRGEVTTHGVRRIGTSAVRWYKAGERVYLRGQLLIANRVRWALYHGSWPDGIVRLRDRDKAAVPENLIIIDKQSLWSEIGAKNRKIHSVDVRETRSGDWAVYRGTFLIATYKTLAEAQEVAKGLNASL